MLSKTIDELEAELELVKWNVELKARENIHLALRIDRLREGLADIGLFTEEWGAVNDLLTQDIELAKRKS